jgi:MGT family glycosyltransferase
MAARAPTVLFFPEGAYGPTNNCVGIADVLRRRGAHVVFVVEESFAGTLEAQDFDERLMRLGPAPETEEEPGQFWKDFIRETAPVFRKPTIEQLEAFIRPTWQALVEGSKYVDGRLREIFDEVRPDVIVEDNVVAFPAIAASGRPWVRIVSCNPLELPDPALPPVFSGYSGEDEDGWPEFREEYRRTHTDLHGDFDTFLQERGAPPLPALEFMHESSFLNLYVYPAEADYLRSRPLDSTWQRLDSCVRATDDDYDLPAALRDGSGKVLYLSLGTLGSADTSLMQRLIDVLGATEHGVVVSMGPQHEELTLASNMIGAEFLPQTKILPQIDLVITHGGNNTVTESFYFGKPSIVLPLFWDQYDNAQRIDELGFGRRLPTYAFEDGDLTGAIDRLLGDDALAGRLNAIAERLQASPGTARAAELIETAADGDG